MSVNRATQPLRDEHAGLLPSLDELGDVAAALARWDPETSPDQLSGVVEFLSHHLIPHALAEEAALYPRVDQALGAKGATESMIADHREIVARIDALAATVAALGAGPPATEETESLRAQLYGLHAILVLHFRKEEDVLLPVLDRTLSDDDAKAMFAEMVAVAHPESPQG